MAEKESIHSKVRRTFTSAFTTAKNNDRKISAPPVLVEPPSPDLFSNGPVGRKSSSPSINERGRARSRSPSIADYTQVINEAAITKTQNESLALFSIPLLGPDGEYFFGNWRKNSIGAASTSTMDETDFVESIPSCRGASVDSAQEFRKDTASQPQPREVQNVNLQIRPNAKVHHTEEFRITRRKNNPHLVLRRGQTFNIELKFDSNFDPETDEVRLAFEIGDYPRESRGTRIVLPVKNKPPPPESLSDKHWWWAEQLSLNGNLLKVKILIGANAIVGCWNLKVISSKKQDKVNFYQSARRDPTIFELIYPIYGIYILFNPWCPEDDVFMENETDRQEYVNNDVGKIWRGSHNSLKPTSWVYGQFESLILESCMLVLDKSKMPLPLRASPIHAARTISAMVNSPNDDGILEGNWSGKFRGGTPPTDWTGSIPILHEWAQSGSSVRFGQCWVFAGVITTLLRCLGIPCRPVTCYSSAHDTDSSVTIDVHMDIDGIPLKELNRDGVWNFHTWNDCWMRRPDLPASYSGWQVVDGTPQERSDGVFRVGPAPLMAVKNGELGLSFDTAFVYAEVNADKCYWIHTGSAIRFVNKDTEAIGKRILTRRPGSKLSPFNQDMMDITIDYKHPEKTLAERRTMMNALFTCGSQAAMAYRTDALPAESDVKFDLDMHKSILIGKSFPATVKIANISKEERTIYITIRVDAVMYMGTASQKIRSNRAKVTLKAGQGTDVAMDIIPEDYMGKLLDQSAFLVSVFAHVRETGQIFVDSDDYRLQMPDIHIQVKDSLQVGEKCRVDFELQNPLNMMLTNCRFTLDAPGLGKPMEIVSKSTATPYGNITATTTLVPERSGPRGLTVHFTSTQLRDVDGYTEVNVKPGLNETDF